MAKVTSVTSQKKGDRLNVFLDGEFAFGISYETAYKFGVKEGEELTDEDIADIAFEEGNVAAFARGLKYAVKKVSSEKQMKQYLYRIGFPRPSIELAVEKLKSYGYIDDAGYAKAYVATYGGERGSLRLKRELSDAGLASEIIEEALVGFDDASVCESCIDKFLRTHKADRNKLINYLLYRGFDYDTIREALEGREL